MTYELALDLDRGEQKLSAKVLTDELREEYTVKLAIRAEDINTCCIEHPLLTNDIIYHYEMAQAESSRLEDEIKRAYAQLDPAVRSHLKGAGAKVTEKMVENFIKDHKEYVAMQEIMHAAKRNAGKWKALVEAVHARKYMLTQVANNYRAEGFSDITVRDRVEEARRLSKASNA